MGVPRKVTSKARELPTVVFIGDLIHGKRIVLTENMLGCFAPFETREFIPFHKNRVDPRR